MRALNWLSWDPWTNATPSPWRDLGNGWFINKTERLRRFPWSGMNWASRRKSLDGIAWHAETYVRLTRLCCQKRQTGWLQSCFGTLCTARSGGYHAPRTGATSIGVLLRNWNRGWRRHRPQFSCGRISLPPFSTARPTRRSPPTLVRPPTCRPFSRATRPLTSILPLSYLPWTCKEMR